MKFYLHLNFDINMYFKFIFVVIQSSNFFNIHYYIPNLKGDNYKIWKERILFYLGWMDIDYTIRKDEPPAITSTNTLEDIALYKW
jgi:hypothetical protein